MDRGELIACDTLPALLSLQEGLVAFPRAGFVAALRERLRTLKECRLLEAQHAAGSQQQATLASLADGWTQEPAGVGSVATLHDRMSEIHLVASRSSSQEKKHASNRSVLDAGADRKHVFLHLTGKGCVIEPPANGVG